MTINTGFTSGQILTAAQMTNLPWGIAALTSKTTDSAITVTETVFLTASFTAVANRYYRITYFEGDIYNANGANPANIIARIRNGTTTAGTELQFATLYTLPGGEGVLNTVVVKTFTAGAQSIVATLVQSLGTGTAFHTASRPGQLIIEDIGPV
jgi:hypothetical protein